MKYEELLKEIEESGYNGDYYQQSRVNALIGTLCDKIGRDLSAGENPSGWEMNLLNSLVQSVNQKKN